MAESQHKHGERPRHERLAGLRERLFVGLTPDDIPWRYALVLAAGIVLGLGLLRVIWLVARPLALLFAAIVIAQALAPVVDFLARKLPRSVAVILTYAILLLILVGVGWFAFPKLTDQVQTFTDKLPEHVDRVKGFLDRFDGNLQNSIVSRLSTYAESLVKLPIAIVSSTLDLVLVIFLSIYWLIYQPTLWRFTLSLFPQEHRESASKVLSEMGHDVGGFVRGVVIDSAIIGILTYIGLLIIGVDYPILLALVAGLGEVVPIIGPMVAAIPAIGVALFESPTQALIVLGFYVVLQQVESNILTPVVMRNQSNVPPPLVLLAVFAGGAVAGIVGALIAIPLVAALRVFVVRVLVPAEREEVGAVESVEQPDGA